MDIKSIIDKQCDNKYDIIAKHIENGVIIKDILSTYIEKEVVIGEGTVIYPNVSIRGNSAIGANCVIDSNSIIEDTVLGCNVSVLASVLKQVTINGYTTVGPYAYLRDNAVIGEKCRVGDFVEIKKSRLGNETKVAHLAYIGDAIIGDECNVGCGTIFANYDGKNKHKTVVGNRVFIGSNTNIIAPRTIGSDVFIAAGTTITHDLPDGAMCIGRAKDEIKEGRAYKYKK